MQVNSCDLVPSFQITIFLRKFQITIHYIFFPVYYIAFARYLELT
jgi:hypothetical protein